MVSLNVETIARPKLLSNEIVRKVVSPLLQRVWDRPAVKLCEIVAQTAGQESLLEASRCPEFLGSIYKRIDQMDDARVHLLIKKYLSEV